MWLDRTPVLTISGSAFGSRCSFRSSSALFAIIFVRFLYLQGSVERSRHERHFCSQLPYFFLSWLQNWLLTPLKKKRKEKVHRTYQYSWPPTDSDGQAWPHIGYTLNNACSGLGVKSTQKPRQEFTYEPFCEKNPSKTMKILKISQKFYVRQAGL